MTIFLSKAYLAIHGRRVEQDVQKRVVYQIPQLRDAPQGDRLQLSIDSRAVPTQGPVPGDGQELDPPDPPRVQARLEVRLRHLQRQVPEVVHLKRLEFHHAHAGFKPKNPKKKIQIGTRREHTAFYDPTKPQITVGSDSMDHEDKMVNLLRFSVADVEILYAASNCARPQNILLRKTRTSL